MLIQSENKKEFSVQVDTFLISRATSKQLSKDIIKTKNSMVLT